MSAWWRALLFGSLVAAAVAQQAVRQHAVAAGPGALLVFTTRDAPAGKGGVCRYHVAALDEDSGPAVFLEVAANVTLHRRLDLRRLLLGLHQQDRGLFVVDLVAGTRRRVCDDPTPPAFVRGGDLVYIDGGRGGAGRLMLRSWTTADEPRRAAEGSFRELAVRGDVAVAERVDPAGIWAVDLVRGTQRRLADRPEGAIALDLAIAPGERQVAMGTAHGTRGAITVFDLDDAEVVQQWRGLPIHLPLVSSSMPTMAVGWRGPQQLVCSESRGRSTALQFVLVTRDMATGEVVDEAPYETGVFHRLPGVEPRPVVRLGGSWWRADGEPELRGEFVQRGDALYFADADGGTDGGADGLAARCDESVQTGGRVMLTPDGRYALVPRDDGAWVLDRIDGRTRMRRRLHHGWTFDHRWLPPAR